MAIDKKFKAKVMRFYDNRRRTIKPVKGDFFKLDNEKVISCCAVGAACLAKGKLVDENTIDCFDVDDASVYLHRSVHFLDGVIDGFDKLGKTPEAHESTNSKRRYLDGYDTGEAIRKAKFKS